MTTSPPRTGHRRVDSPASPDAHEPARSAPASAPDDRSANRRDAMLEDLGHAYDFAVARGRPAAFFCLAQDEPLGTATVRELGRAVVDLAERQHGGRIADLDLVVDSVGGDIHAAYRLVSLLYDKTERFSACVPSYARSAATLLCVAADRIVLDDLAVLGPLDAQVYESGRTYRPALNTFKSLERITVFSLDTLRTASEAIEKLNMTGEQALTYALQFVKTMSESMFAPMEATRIGEYSQALAVGERYGDRLYDRRPREGMAKDEWRRMISHLVNDYPNHEVVIDAAELNRLRLPVEPFGKRERHAARALAERPGMQRLVVLLDPARIPPKPEWLAGADVARLIERETQRRIADGVVRRTRQTVYDVRSVTPIGWS